MNRYYTGLIPISGERLTGILPGRGWKVYTSKARQEVRKHSSTKPGPTQEIVIEAHNAPTAQKALNLIRTADQLLEAAPETFGYRFKVIPADSGEHKRLYPSPLDDPSYSWINKAGFPEACSLAAKASRKRSYVYAFALFHLSQSLHSNHPMDLEPRLFPYEHRSPIPDDHVRFAYSIVTAYAILEQLGLALHGQAFENRKWIPTKKADLEKRLQKVGINYHKPIGWLLRDGKTRIERSRNAPTAKRAEWAWGQ